MGSKIQTGFQRIGLVLSVPLLILSLVLAVMELSNPSGARLPREMSPGMLAWKPDDATDARIKSAIEQQVNAGYGAPPNFVLIGRVISKVPSDAIHVALLDGREIELQTPNEKEIANLSGVFITSMKPEDAPQGSRWEIELPNQTKVTLRVVKADQEPGWPYSGPRSRNWWPTLLALAAALVLYSVPRAIGWIIQGFAGPGSSA